MRMRRRVAGAAMLLIGIAGRAGDDAPTPGAGGVGESPEDPVDETGEQADQRFPDVVDAELRAVLDPRGEVLAEHDLAHDHAGEQPFTRTRGPFAIPERVTEVTVEGRDLEHGYGGETVTIEVPRLR